jgi:enoyl-CoA hydratase
MNYENILTEKKNQILYITINRASKLNALNKATLNELHVAFDHAINDKEVRAIILTGDGTKAFVAGADISEFAHFSVEEGKRLSAEGHEKVFNFIENCTKPVIAAINGFALGGGLELAMSCHIRVASDNAKMGLPEVSLGVIPGYGGTQRLSQLVGKGKAFEMIMTADMVTAEEAYRIGLVNHISTLENLIVKCEEIASKIITKSPVAIAHAIRSVNAGYTDGINGYEVEIDEFGKCFGTNDFKEGTSAFLEKRKAEFKGN